jgi:hypothetical protein
MEDEKGRGVGRFSLSCVLRGEAGNLEEGAKQIAVNGERVLRFLGAEELPEQKGAANGECDVVRIGVIPAARGPIITATLIRAEDVDMSIQAGEEIGAFLAAEIVAGGLIGDNAVVVVPVILDKLGGRAVAFGG